jgi:hypothetical protein
MDGEEPEHERDQSNNQKDGVERKEREEGKTRKKINFSQETLSP